MNVGALIQIWDRVRTSLWFVPAIMVCGALVLAGAGRVIDGLVPDAWARSASLLFSGRAPGARVLLATIATSMIGVAGVVFSMTIVSLQLASSQFGPRLLRTFLRDRGNQVVLGTFLGTFVYCIVVLPMIDTAGEAEFVPHVAVTIAVLLAILSLGMLVYYIDHVAQSIHADAVMHSVGRELESVIDDLYPEDVGEEVEREDTAFEPPRGEPAVIRSKSAGYVRFINGDRLLDAAAEGDLFVRLRVAPGAYSIGGDCLAEVWPASAVSEAMEEHVCAAFAIGAHRTALQDVSFVFEQLAEMAMRALSPGIHDPTTAAHCIDRMGTGLARLVTRELPSRRRLDASGRVRVEIEEVGLEDLLDLTIIAVSRTAGVHLPVWLRLLAVLEVAAERAIRRADRELLHAAARSVASQGRAAVLSEDDRAAIEAASAWGLEMAPGRDEPGSERVAP